MSHSTQSRVPAARAILAAKTYEDQKLALTHWGLFMSAQIPSWKTIQDEASYVFEAFGVLREEVVVWYLGHLESRIEELENPNGGRLGDHR